MLKIVILVTVCCFAICGSIPKFEGLSGEDPDPGQKTVQGCRCTSSCGATVDFGAAASDWCYTAGNCGSFSITRASWYDWCVYPANQTYESQTAEAKQFVVWNMLKRDQTGGSYPSKAGLLGIFTESVKTTFTDNADFMPAGRTKYIHSVGSVAKVRFVADTNSPYTGIFRGNRFGIVRLSSAAAPSDTTLTPGFGIKFFRTGRQSANFMAMPGLDGQSDFNFFKLEFTNKPALPSGFALKLVAQKFWQASRCPLRVGLSDSAIYREDGTQEASPRFPWRIIFKPTGSVQFPSAPYDENKLGQLLAGIANGTTLFDVYANESPNDVGPDTRIRMGSLVTNSEFIKSTYGDNKLMFKHIWSESDFNLRRNWLDQIKNNQKAICGMEGVTPVPPADIEQ